MHDDTKGREEVHQISRYLSGRRDGRYSAYPYCARLRRTIVRAGSLSLQELFLMVCLFCTSGANRSASLS